MSSTPTRRWHEPRARVPRSLRTSYRNRSALAVACLCAVVMVYCVGATVVAASAGLTAEDTARQANNLVVAALALIGSLVALLGLARGWLGRRHDLVVDATGLQRDGAVGWSVPWDEIKRVEITYRAPQYHLTVMPKTGRGRPRSLWALAGERWMPRHALGVIVPGDDVETVADMCAAREVRVVSSTCRALRR